MCGSSLHTRVAEFSLVVSSCVRVGTWAGRITWRGAPRHGDANRTTGGCLELTVLCSMILALLLMIGGTEQNTGPVVEVENTEQLLCTGCCRNLMGTAWALV